MQATHYCFTNETTGYTITSVQTKIHSNRMWWVRITARQIIAFSHVLTHSQRFRYMPAIRVNSVTAIIANEFAATTMKVVTGGTDSKGTHNLKAVTYKEMGQNWNNEIDRLNFIRYFYELENELSIFQENQ